MTDILVYIEAVCIMASRFLILYAVFCVAKIFWKQFRHAANKIYSHVTGDAESLFPKKQCICQVKKSEMAEMMSKKSGEGLCTKKAFRGKMTNLSSWFLRKIKLKDRGRLTCGSFFCAKIQLIFFVTLKFRHIVSVNLK